MAVMIPQNPREFTPASLEDVMFDALRQLPDEYYVFHSLSITDVVNNLIRENETDFMILHQKKGIICLEAKAGPVKYEDGVWKYGSGRVMDHDGPYNQASGNKHRLMKYIKNGKMADILHHCRFYHAVWFPSITEEQLKSIPLPGEGDRTLTLTKEALTDPEKYLERVYSLVPAIGISNDISDGEFQRLLREVLCPQFNVFPTASFEADLKKIVFHRLLKEQAGILNFLEDQKTAAINGAAGTGKTMIALEKARRHASQGEPVLFLCFNSFLRDYLEKNYPQEKVSFFTIPGFACKICGTAEPNYVKAMAKLEDMFISGKFPYKHIIIDEGQDFGQEAINEAKIIDTLHDIVTDDDMDGTFYVFYDKLQLIQAKEMPDFIDNLDCRLTLYRNCRNTENIATTSLRPIAERKPKLLEGAIKGAPAKIHYCAKDTEKERIDGCINSLLADGVKDIVLLTCKTEQTSLLAPFIKDGKYRKKYLFTTCRKFKGLEADAIIMVDVDRDTFNDSNKMLFYVGASRARLNLDIMAVLSDDDCKEILERLPVKQPKITKPKRDFAAALNTVGCLTE